jgi:beta-glucosidase
MSDRDEAPFPDDCIWGAATASYQIEGAVAVDGRGPSIWDIFSHTPGKTVNGDTGDVACDHYHRWREDIGIMRELGLQAYRFSIAWPRVIPNGRGPINPAGLDFYDRLVDELLANDIQPFATLYHWDLPQALEDEGGWPHRQTADRFAEYVDAVTRRLGDRVTHWITLNEPWVAAMLGYYMGIHAPGRTSLADGLAAAHTLLLGHGQAMETITANVPAAEVGITLNLSSVYPGTDKSQDVEAARLADGTLNRWFLDPLFKGSYPEDVVRAVGDAMPEVRDGDLNRIAQPVNFLGVNYYSPQHVVRDPNGPLGVGMVDRKGEHTAMGWLVQPEGLRDLLVRLNEDYGPALYVTENGAAYDDPPPTNGRVPDPRRAAYIHDHLLACDEAIRNGVPLRGYFCWSLLDNFEWAEGYSKRFGITFVDYPTEERTIKESGRWYRRVIDANGVVPV